MSQALGCLRVSTLDQDLEKNKADILHLANSKALGQVRFVEEKASGRISWRKRKIAEIIAELKQGDAIIVSELSRLGRSMLEKLELWCSECPLKDFTQLVAGPQQDQGLILFLKPTKSEHLFKKHLYLFRRSPIHFRIVSALGLSRCENRSRAFWYMARHRVGISESKNLESKDTIVLNQN